jgi:SnoaL-like protein
VDPLAGRDGEPALRSHFSIRMGTVSKACEEWHRIVRERDVDALDQLLADDVVFHSPVVHTPQRGRPLTTMYLAAALMVLGNETFQYVREIIGEREAALEFVVVVDSIEINGIDLIRWNDADRIVDFKVLLRPLKAIHLVHAKMGALLQPPR